MMTSILVVEDEAMVRDAIVADLRDEGYDVADAANADEALAVLGACPIDVLFTDIRMPGSMDGWELAKLAQRDKPALRVIYASGYTPDGAICATPFLQKPYRTKQLLTLLKDFGASP